jgi:hypothetical protein
VSFRNERMARGFRSLDRLADTIDLGKSRLVSDCGAGARQIRRAADGEEASPREDARAARLAEARRRLVESGLARLVPVLDQIVRNGKNRQESICNLAAIWRQKKPIARVNYYRGVNTMLALFQPIKTRMKRDS